jgi:hypothetical protein
MNTQQPTIEQTIADRLAQTPVDQYSTDATAAERRSICGACEYKITTEGYDQCTLCGCFTELKAKLNNAACPADKWTVIFVQSATPPPVPAPPSIAENPPLPDWVVPVDPSQSTIVTLMAPLY